MSPMKWFRRRRDGLSPQAIESLRQEVRTILETRSILCRFPDDDGPRIYVTGLRGSFRFSREEAERRIRAEWPQLDDAGVSRAVTYLAARVRAADERPRQVAKPTGWVHAWKGHGGASAWASN